VSVTTEKVLVPYRQPGVEPVELTVVPRLASWERKDSPEQVRLAAYLEHMRVVFERAAEEVEGPLAAELSVGLPERVDLLVHSDLDNFLEPLARVVGPRVCSWWARKSHAANSRFAVGPAVRTSEDELVGWEFAAARATASASTAGWKQAVNEQIAATCQVAKDGALEVQIVFRVGPGRNWINLWKPAIDALDPILGRTDPQRAFHPRDDRIIRLALHRVVDVSAEYAVELGVWWRLAPVQAPSTSGRAARPGATAESQSRLSQVNEAVTQHDRKEFGMNQHVGAEELAKRLDTLEEFREALRRPGVIVITDASTGTKIHSRTCTYLKEEWFERKVIRGRGRTGRYWWVREARTAQERFPRAVRCAACYG
jgi:hypothetical protein